ncbi:MAG TPA: UDP-N-acetylglucosamine 1-carboxyvinyltransferase [Dissulfuribacter thermophilus]|uniref:UDP-N-acetylglucosamine 1-carboxyvinyltransferase n=1 Tax=Dissulfuribacter thermophilus TaxID=1156395 RepID=A0A7V2WSS3_9BACT|nr:UDP-N-acetylglucosamine 1-carboxyvinyltransferase [Dissulfuribacter thermophilus]
MTGSYLNGEKRPQNALEVTGGRRLSGEVRISGAKNAALPILCATILAPGSYRIENCPRLTDVFTLIELLERLGAQASWDLSSVPLLDPPPPLFMDTSGLASFEAPFELVRKMRASFLVLGPLVARFGRARVPLPGGCEIGARPVDFHLQGLKALGAQWEIDSGFVDVRATGLKGARILLDFPSVTGTENILMAAVLAKGTSVIENAAMEPEVVDLGEMLIKMGAKIKGLGTPSIVIEGVDELRPVSWKIIPDRIEAGTFMVAVGITGGELGLLGAEAGHLDAVISKLSSAGLKIVTGSGRIDVERSGPIESVDVTTSPFPGFPTDLQAQMVALMAYAKGLSVIKEQVFENRFRHVDELRRLGADIRVEQRSAIIRGRSRLKGAPLTATDLRASASLVLAGLGAEGVTRVLDIHHLDRGYEALDEKLRQVGARIERV